MHHTRRLEKGDLRRIKDFFFIFVAQGNYREFISRVRDLVISFFVSARAEIVGNFKRKRNAQKQLPERT